MKTIEEKEKMRDVVLAECERVCPAVGKYFDVQIGGQAYKVIRPDNEIRYVFWTTVDSPHRVADIAKWHGDEWWPLHYAMLGLSERDAVEAERVELIETFGQLKMQAQTERERSAKLVEALEKIATAHEDGGRRINGHHALGIKELSFKMMECAQAAIDDHKKGGAGE